MRCADDSSRSKAARGPASRPRSALLAQRLRALADRGGADARARRLARRRSHPARPSVRRRQAVRSGGRSDPVRGRARRSSATPRSSRRWSAASGSSATASSIRRASIRASLGNVDPRLIQRARAGDASATRAGPDLHSRRPTRSSAWRARRRGAATTSADRFETETLEFHKRCCARPI